MNVLSHAWESVRLWWQSATPAARAGATAVGVLIVVALAAAAALSARPDFHVIARDIDSSSAADMKKVLDDKGIAMTYSDTDRTVGVPSKDASNALMYISAEGLVSKDTRVRGFDPLQPMPMGTSTAVEDLRIRQANESELTRQLLQLDPVQTAIVKISSGGSGGLFGDATHPSASVVLSLKGGAALNPVQIKGIVNLIAHAVPGLAPADVTLLDQSGTPLWRDNGAGGLADGQPMDENAKFAEKKREELQVRLDQVLGPRKSLVMVNAELDLDQTQVDQTEHTTAGGARTGAPISERAKEESYEGSGAAGAGGAAGAASNGAIPTYAGGASGGAGGKFKSSDTVTNYQPDIRRTVTQKAPGSTRQLSVAVLVDTSVPKASLDALKPIIQTAIGALPGDTSRFVDIRPIAFDTSAQKADQSLLRSAQSQQLMSTIAKAAAVAVVAVVLLFMLMRSGRTPAPQLAHAGGGEHIGLLHADDAHALDDIAVQERPLRIEDVLAEMPEATPSPRRARRRPAPSIEEQQDLKMESIQDMISSSPESVALLLKGWMTE